MKTNECNVLALYRAGKSKLDFQRWFSTSMDILSNYNIQPNFVGLTSNRFPEKMMPFKKPGKQMEKLNLDNLGSLTWMVCPEGSSANDWYVYFSVSNWNGVELIFCVDQSVVSFGSDQFEGIIQRLCMNDMFTYGYAYQREYSKGPEYYALGMSKGVDFNSVESEEIANWARDRRNENSIQRGYLRDIYPYNFLTTANLNKKVLGVRLRDLINQPNGTLGNIRAIKENLFLWKLETPELANARHVLKPMLICNRVVPSN